MSANGKPLLLLLFLLIGTAMLYGLFTRIKIEFVSDTPKNLARKPHYGFESLGKMAQNQNVVTVVIPLEEIKQRNRERAIEPLLKENVAADDPRLVQAIRDHFIDPPSKLLPKMSRPLVRTPQAEAVEEILARKKGGFYIECGALDGERSSNSIYFEQKLNWKGILIEMDPSWYRQIEGKNRKAYSMNACLSVQPYPVKMDFEGRSDGTGQLTVKRSTKSNPVYCFPLLSVMLAMNQTHIDYFSLDVEGFELDILKTVPFDRLDITTFSVEYEHAAGGGKETILKIMNDNGYKLHSTINTDSPVWARDFIFVKR